MKMQVKKMSETVFDMYECKVQIGSTNEDRICINVKNNDDFTKRILLRRFKQLRTLTDTAYYNVIKKLKQTTKRGVQIHHFNLPESTVYIWEYANNHLIIIPLSQTLVAILFDTRTRKYCLLCDISLFF